MRSLASVFGLEPGQKLADLSLQAGFQNHHCNMLQGIKNSNSVHHAIVRGNLCSRVHTPASPSSPGFDQRAGSQSVRGAHAMTQVEM